MAELVLGSAALGKSVRARKARVARGAREMPILVGAMADEFVRAGPVERHRKLSFGRRQLAKCDRPPLVVGW